MQAETFPRDALSRRAVEMASSRRIRVAYFLDSFAIGGTELNAVRSAEALDPDRIELCVFHLQTHGPLRPRYEQLGVRMTHIPIPNLYSPRTALQGMRFAELLRRWDVDVVHSQDIYSNVFAVPWSRVLSRCSIVASRRWWYDTPRPELAKVNRWCSQLAHRILANSSGVAELIAREEGVARSRIVEVPNFLAESAFEAVDEPLRTAQRRAWGIPDGAFAIGIVARLSPVKNHGLLIRAIAQLDERFHLVVIGDGPSRTELEDLARQLRIGPRTHFTGEVLSPHNPHQFLDVSVLVSLTEGFPNSMIEAMAAARPVVVTPVGGVADAVTNGVTGIIVAHGDTAALVDALLMLEADPFARSRLGEAGRKAVRAKFHQTFVIERLMALYESLADHHRAAMAGRAND